MEESGKLHNIFDSYESESSDPGMDWSEMGPIINSALDQKKKRKRRGIFYWIFGSALLIGTLTFFIFLSESGIDTEENIASIEDQSQVNKNQSKNVLIIEEVNEHSAENTEENIIEIKSQTNNQKEITTTAINSSIGKRIERNHSKSTLYKKPISQNTVPYTTQVSTQNRPSESFSTSDSHKTISKISPAALSNLDPKVKSIELDYLARIESDLLLITYNLDILDNVTLEPKIDIVLDEKSRLTVLAFSGISRNNLDQYYNNTSPLPGLNIDFLLQKNLTNSLFIESGLSIDQQRLQTAFEDTTSIKIHKPDTPDTIYYYGINQEIVYTDSINGIGIRSFGHTNKITSISIPLSIGYRAQLGKFTLGTQLGLGFDIFQKVDLRTPDNIFEVQSRSSSTELSFTPRYFGVFSINYRINSKAYMSGRYRVSRQTIHPWNDQEKLFFSSQGFQVGLSFKI